MVDESTRIIVGSKFLADDDLLDGSPPAAAALDGAGNSGAARHRGHHHHHREHRRSSDVRIDDLETDEREEKRKHDEDEEESGDREVSPPRRLAACVDEGQEGDTEYRAKRKSKSMQSMRDILELEEAEVDPGPVEPQRLSVSAVGFMEQRRNSTFVAEQPQRLTHGNRSVTMSAIDRSQFCRDRRSVQPPVRRGQEVVFIPSSKSMEGLAGALKRTTSVEEELGGAKMMLTVHRCVNLPADLKAPDTFVKLYDRKHRMPRATGVVKHTVNPQFEHAFFIPSDSSVRLEVWYVSVVDKYLGEVNFIPGELLGNGICKISIVNPGKPSDAAHVPEGGTRGHLYVSVMLGAGQTAISGSPLGQSRTKSHAKQKSKNIIKSMSSHALMSLVSLGSRGGSKAAF
eukprot:TRINITY_DN6234_c0_g1_i1.p2 TRINITY_DN6234_c0_g1~~TRINITY_DN6234_c0_g1_i1.p2  ORF type:complete len:400 (+),score=110.11 TRINITY_DN6234_c0_g1_i1:89-1288(+)